MVVPESIRRRMYNLYCLGVTQGKIAEKFAVDPMTVSRIKNTENWEELRRQDMQMAEEFALNSIKKTNESIRNLIKQKGVEALQKDLERPSPRDLIAVMTLDRLEAGQSTENIAIKQQLTLDEAYAEYMKREAEKKRLAQGDGSVEQNR